MPLRKPTPSDSRPRSRVNFNCDAELMDDILSHARRYNVSSNEAVRMLVEWGLNTWEQELSPPRPVVSMPSMNSHT